MREITDISDCNGKTICTDDTITLFGMNGIVTFKAGAYGIYFNKIDWDLIHSKIPEITGCDNKPYFCENDNFISFWELIWNFNCKDNYCSVISIINETKNNNQ